MKSFSKIVFSLFLLTAVLFSRADINPRRVVTVDIFLDEECQQFKWDDYFKTLIGHVSVLFEKNFSISFSVNDIRTWKSDNDINTLNSLFQDFCRKNLSRNGDICLGFTAQKNLRGHSGISLYQEARILVRVSENRDYLLKVLAHELSHIFGAAHVDNPKSLMDRFLKGSRFDDLNRKIITLHHNRKFNTIRYPLPAEWFQYLVNLYQSIVQSNEKLKTSKLPGYRKDQLRKQLNSKQEIDSETLQIAFRRLDDVYIYQTFLFIEMERYDDALNACQKVLKIKPGLTEAYNLMGIASRRKGDFDGAIRFYQQVLKENPCYPKVNYNLGIALAKKGEMEKAISFYRKSIRCNDNFAAPWNNLGYIALEQGKINFAVKYFQKAISINPYHPLAHSNLAEAYLRKKMIPESRKEVKKALDLDSTFPGPHNVQGNIFSELGDLIKAEIAYRRAISRQSTYYKAYYNLGNLWFKKKSYVQAVSFFQKSVQINPGFGMGYAGLGDCYLLLSRFKEAESAFKKAFARGYETAKLHLNLSYIQIRNKDFPLAIESARRAIQLEPNLEMAHKNLGIVYFSLGKLPQAEKEFKRVLEINPQNGNIHRNLFVVSYLQKEYQKARLHMEMAEKMGIQVDRELKRELERILAKGQKNID
jgi:tetratricopeptide (TPR) repeat protein